MTALFILAALLLVATLWWLSQPLRGRAAVSAGSERGAGRDAVVDRWRVIRLAECRQCAGIPAGGGQRHRQHARAAHGVRDGGQARKASRRRGKRPGRLGAARGGGWWGGAALKR